MRDDRCHIAIIDDGVCLSAHNPPILCYKDFTNNIDAEENTAHSSIVAQIIKKYNTECVISSIKVIAHHGNGKVADFVRAIKWCMENHIDVIHLSIGTTHFADFSVIYAAITEAVTDGITIVASQSNDCLFTLPACLDSVIGVRNSDECRPGEFIIQYNNWDGVDIVASSRFTITKSSGHFERLKPSNSFASPYITALVSKLITCHGKIGKSTILAYLEKEAKRVKGKWLQQNQKQQESFITDCFAYYKQDYGNRMVRVYKKILTPIIHVNNKDIHELLFDHFISAGYNCYPAIIDTCCTPAEQHSFVQNNIQLYLSLVDIKYDPDMFVVLTESNLIPHYDARVTLGEDLVIAFCDRKEMRFSKNQIREMIHELSIYFT